MDDNDYTPSDDEIAVGYDSMKRHHGTVACKVFLVSAFYHHVAFGGFGSLFGIWSIAFFCVGMFAAPLTIGIASYLLQRLIGKVPVDPFNTSTAIVLVVLGWGLFAFQLVATWLATRLVYLWLFTTSASSERLSS